MGLLRLWLAFCVLRDHTTSLGSSWMPDGVSAVQAFFVLSGFAMAMVLEEKYRGDHRQFWIQRWIKLWPAYIVVMVMALAYEIPLWITRHIGAGVVQEFAHGPRPSAFTWLLLGMSNLSMAGQDLLGLLGLDGQGMPALALNPSVSTFTLDHYTVIPQAWSLSTELVFYALAPWYVRLSTRNLILIFSCAVLGRTVYGAAGLPVSRWASHFSLLALPMFAPGILSWRACRAMAAPCAWPMSLLGWAAILLAPWVCRDPSWQGWALGLSTALALPWIFLPLRGLALDRLVGEWAYPMYLLHYLIAYVGLDLASALHGQPKFWMLALASLALSGLFWRALRGPLADMRRRWIKPLSGEMGGS